MIAKSNDALFSIQAPRERTFQEWFKGVEDSTVNIVDRITSAPSAARDAADSLEDQLLSAFDRIKGRSEETAKDNVIKSRVERIFRKAGDWLTTGNNIYIAGAAVIAIIIWWKR